MKLSASIDILFVGVNKTEKLIIEGYLGLGTRTANLSTSSYSDTEKVLEQHSPRTIICEAEALGLDVRAICRDLVDKPCVFLSSRDRDLERRKSLLCVRECYLTRPYSRGELSRAIEKADTTPKAVNR